MNMSMAGSTNANCRALPPSGQLQGEYHHVGDQLTADHGILGILVGGLGQNWHFVPRPNALSRVNYRTA